MITFKILTWSDAFSYGPNNWIDFTENSIVQLVGKNGHGKSSIALILEEVLYNKNSKGIKKANILNRNSKSKFYNITLDFYKDNDVYSIETTRGTTQSVKLICNGKDISAHTSTATYKLIENIIGYDHKTFTQIVCQNNAFSLEFLTATDTNRKKFLIDLLRLGKYTELAELVKVDLKTVNQEAELLGMKLNTVNSWLSKYKPEDLVTKELLDNVPPPILETQELAQLEETLRTLEQTNKRITQNNKYIEILSSISLEIVPAPTSDIVNLKVELSKAKARVRTLQDAINKTGPIINKCPSCGQNVDNTHKQLMLEEARALLPEALSIVAACETELYGAEAAKTKYDESVKNTQEWEKYSNLIDKTLQRTLLDQADITGKVVKLRKYIKDTNTTIQSINAKNVEIEAHNAKVNVILGQMSDMQTDKKKYELQLAVVNSRQSSLQILVKTLSPSGFVAYKIESLVKDLEELTNEYLTEISDGRFQLSFRISASDKLDVVITDNGDDIDIYALSTGELARVNTSTLLAIRKLMQSLSNARTNLLILDETVENLDAEGKEKLIEILLGEEHLNTILVSHGFSHPLLAKLDVVKEGNMSRIER